ncbi:hypothetical protein ES695_21430 [Candidatus Atribacteria bacterium 1244-E10-H5-B2]|nr:MAG: hypothetical protein ES695_21430 [Candidatus Atribacteria bacterium 1244-E10-H5-B2]
MTTNDNLKAEIERRLKGINLIDRLRLGYVSEIALAELVIILQDDIEECPQNVTSLAKKNVVRVLLWLC